MSYVTVATLTDQTAVVIPRHTGQSLRLGEEIVETVAEEPARIMGTGDLELSTGWWDMLTIVDGNYWGAPFDGQMPYLDVDGAFRRPVWDGEPDASTTTTHPFPVTVDVTIERDVGGGWERVTQFVDDITLMDWESLSYGDTLYRAVAETVEGATSVTEITVPARSNALWLNGGVGFSLSCRLPLNPRISSDTGRATAEKWYAGRSRPVIQKGEALSDVYQIAGVVADRTFIDPGASPDELRAVIRSGSALHMLRTFDGKRVYGGINAVSLDRQNTTQADDPLRPWNAFWGYGFTLTEGTEQ